MSETSKEAQAATTRILMHVIPRETAMSPHAVPLIDGHIQLAIDAAMKALRAENAKLRAAGDVLAVEADAANFMFYSGSSDEASKAWKALQKEKT